MYSSSAAMDEDDIDMIDGNMTDSEDNSDNVSESDIEYEIERLKEFDNTKQLNILKREIGHIVAHGLMPCEGWYDERFTYINEYSKLGWAEMARRFHGKDQYLHDTAVYIMRLLDELLEERGSKPNFHLPTYHRVIHDIHNIWNYYSQVYMGSEEDTDVVDLIEGMKFLCK